MYHTLKEIGVDLKHDTIFPCGLQSQRILVLKNNIELGQFQTNSPRYIPISEEFWKALARLPTVYDYATYRKVLERFGTHYLAGGSLGGSFSVVARIDQETQTYMSEREQVSSVVFYAVVCVSYLLKSFKSGC